jgi:C-terminal processing protease CtpA/Prc
MRALAIFLLLVSATQAADVPDDLVKRLGDDEYEVRERASSDLEKFAQKNQEDAFDAIMSRLVDEKDLEIRTRLTKQARASFLSSVVEKMPEYQKGRAVSGILLRVSGGNFVTWNVLDNSPADKAGIYAMDDVIVKVDDKDVTGDNMPVLESVYGEKKPGDKVKIEFLRGERSMSAEIVLEEKAYDEEVDGRKKEVIWEQVLAGKIKVPARP